MVDRMKLTPELEAAAHRCAMASQGLSEFYMCARNGVLQYVGVESDMYSLIRGEWHGCAPLEAEVGHGAD